LTFDQAARTHDALVTTYREFGYTLLELPCTDIADRVQFVLENVALEAV
jgi:predicted ATPase